MHPFKKQNILESQLGSNDNKLLIDFSQLVITAVTGSFKTEQEQSELTKFQVKAVVLGSLKDVLKKYKQKYPNVIICCDNASIPYYKRTISPFYKAHRSKSREDSSLNWEMIFSTSKEFIQDLKENFCYQVIDIPGLEADDIIGYLATKGNSGEYHSMIVSSDGDFTQLHSKYTKQYSFIHGKQIEPKTTAFGDLVTKIVKGDTKDAISGIKVPSNHAYNRLMGLQHLNEVQRTPSTRQDELNLYISAKNLDELRNIIPEEYKDRLEENIKLLDLSILPGEYKTLIDAEIDKNKVNNSSNRSKIYTYLLQNNLTKLLDSIQDF
jgi:ribonuclease H